MFRAFTVYVSGHGTDGYKVTLDIHPQLSDDIDLIKKLVNDIQEQIAPLNSADVTEWSGPPNE